MPVVNRGDASIYYEVTGTGFPVLLIAPGGMRSAVGSWPMAAINPLVGFEDEFQLVAMDQRGAGQSRGPLEPGDPWDAFAADQLAVVDALGIDRFHVVGCCIGCSYALKLAQAAPGRVASIVLQQPIGVDGDNRELLAGAWREWGTKLVAEDPAITEAAVEAFGRRMWSGEFVLSVSREFVRGCATPMLVLPGVDRFHPTAIGREVADLALDAELREPWKDSPENIAAAKERVRAFLGERTP